MNESSTASLDRVNNSPSTPFVFTLDDPEKLKIEEEKEKFDTQVTELAIEHLKRSLEAPSSAFDCGKVLVATRNLDPYLDCFIFRNNEDALDKEHQFYKRREQAELEKYQQAQVLAKISCHQLNTLIILLKKLKEIIQNTSSISIQDLNESDAKTLLLLSAELEYELFENHSNFVTAQNKADCKYFSTNSIEPYILSNPHFTFILVFLETLRQFRSLQFHSSYLEYGHESMVSCFDPLLTQAYNELRQAIIQAIHKDPSQKESLSLEKQCNQLLEQTTIISLENIVNLLEPLYERLPRTQLCTVFNDTNKNLFEKHNYIMEHIHLLHVLGIKLPNTLKTYLDNFTDKAGKINKCKGQKLKNAFVPICRGFIHSLFKRIMDPCHDEVVRALANKDQDRQPLPDHFYYWLNLAHQWVYDEKNQIGTLYEEESNDSDFDGLLSMSQSLQSMQATIEGATEVARNMQSNTSSDPKATMTGLMNLVDDMVNLLSNTADLFTSWTKLQRFNERFKSTSNEAKADSSALTQEKSHKTSPGKKKRVRKKKTKEPTRSDPTIAEAILKEISPQGSDAASPSAAKAPQTSTIANQEQTTVSAYRTRLEKDFCHQLTLRANFEPFTINSRVSEWIDNPKAAKQRRIQEYENKGLTYDASEFEYDCCSHSLPPSLFYLRNTKYLYQSYFHQEHEGHIVHEYLGGMMVNKQGGWEFSIGIFQYTLNNQQDIYHAVFKERNLDSIIKGKKLEQTFKRFMENMENDPPQKWLIQNNRYGSLKNNMQIHPSFIRIDQALPGNESWSFGCVVFKP